MPYDSGLAFVRDANHLRNTMALSGAYLQFSEQRDGTQYTPEASRRARGSEIWAALKSLGRRGLAEMIERNYDVVVIPELLGADGALPNLFGDLAVEKLPHLRRRRPEFPVSPGVMWIFDALNTQS